MSLLSLLVFGSLSGMLWSLLPGALSDLLDRASDYLVILGSGAVTGCLVTLLVESYVRHRGLGPWRSLLLAPAVLTLAGLLFGLLLGLSLLLGLDGSIAHRTEGRVGLGFMAYGFLWIHLGWLTIPLAWGNLLALRPILCRNRHLLEEH